MEQARNEFLWELAPKLGIEKWPFYELFQKPKIRDEVIKEVNQKIMDAVSRLCYDVHIGKYIDEQGPSNNTIFHLETAMRLLGYNVGMKYGSQFDINYQHPLPPHKDMLDCELITAQQALKLYKQRKNELEQIAIQSPYKEVMQDIANSVPIRVEDTDTEALRGYNKVRYKIEHKFIKTCDTGAKRTEFLHVLGLYFKHLFRENEGISVDFGEGILYIGYEPPCRLIG